MKRSSNPILSGLVRVASLALLGLGAAACEDDPNVWSTGVPSPLVARSVDGSVALIDDGAHRVLMLSVGGDLELETTSIPIADGFAAAAATPDAQRLLVLSRGVLPRRTADDPGPSLAVIDGGTEPRLEATHALSDPLSGLAVDPRSEFAVIHPSAEDVAFVQNPNELVVVDLAPGAGPPVPITLRSFGGRPQAFTFTDPLGLPGGARRLLVTSTDRDVAVLDLGNLDLPEITIRLGSGEAARRPAGIAVTDGSPDRDDDARIAVRMEGEPDVVIVDLAPVPPEEVETTPQSFRAVPNVVFVGGSPTDLAFVRTDAGLRLAALVPARNTLVLLDPETGGSTEIELGAPFERLSVVTDEVGEAGVGGDVALLWSSSSPQVALVALGGAVGTPYRSLERLDLASPVADVVAVNGENRHLRVLSSSGGDEFVVLDLLSRTAAPLVAPGGGARIVPSFDGERAWLIASFQPAIARVDLTTLHPENFPLSHGVRDVFDVARRGGGRAVIAVHGVGTGSVTVLDALRPSLTTAREYAGLLLGDLQ